jgi:thiamine biosynthesis protein ThiI
LKEVILIKEGEIFLKGLNKKFFESILIKNITSKLQHLGGFEIKKEQSTITIFPDKNFDLDLALRKISKVFGISSFCRCFIVKKDFEEIKSAVIEHFSNILKEAKSFKVTAKRSDKSFKLTSPLIAQKMGEFLLNQFPNLKVDLFKPDFNLNIEVRDEFAYLYHFKQPAAKGMPVGCSGSAILLLSGGIDSPVAGFMMAKRGLNLFVVHFISPPYTGERALQKVKDLILKLEKWTNKIPLYVVNITKLQEDLKKNCPEKLLTILLRRCMIKIAENIGKNHITAKIEALITGESLAQVASQTISALHCTNCASSFPILRPLIGMDKEEIVSIAKKIGTFEISTLPYEDCCTVFTPKHPKTNPSFNEIENIEHRFKINDMLDSVTYDLVDVC